MEGFDGGAKRTADPDKCVAHDVTRLFVEHHAPLFRYLWRLTGDADVAGGRGPRGVRETDRETAGARRDTRMAFQGREERGV